MPVSIRWLRVGIASAVGVALVMAMGARVLRRAPEERGLRPLTDVLWVRDAEGALHGPESPHSRALLARLEGRGVNVKAARHGGPVLLLEPPSGSGDEPVMVTNWQPGAAVPAPAPGAGIGGP